MAKSALILLLSICLVAAGCATTFHVPVDSREGAPLPDIQPGDSAVITMKSGAVRRLKIIDVDAQTLTGQDLDTPHDSSTVQIALGDVQSMEVKRINGTKTLHLVLVSVGVVFAVALGLTIIHQNKCNGCIADN